jgi:nitroreductase
VINIKHKRSGGIVMNVEEAMKRRRSVRKYTHEQITDTEINKLMHAAMSGPSACNAQPWDFYCVRDKAKIEELQKTTRATDFYSPLIIVVCGDMKRSLDGNIRDFWIQDCSASVENILIEAVELGLGTCWCGLKPKKDCMDRVRAALSLDDSIEPLGLIHVGHPAEEPPARDQYTESFVHII